MYVSISRLDGVSDNGIIKVSEFCVSSEFTSLFEVDSVVGAPRVLHHYSDNSSLFLIKHTSFIEGSVLPTSMNLVHVARHGLFDLFSIGLSTNHMSLIYWAVKPMVPVVRWTDYGIVAMTRPPDPDSEIEIYSTTDGLVICGDSDKYSSVLSVETLRFQAT